MTESNMAKVYHTMDAATDYNCCSSVEATDEICVSRICGAAGCNARSSRGVVLICYTLA
jgi:hypothetical protein